MNPDAILFDLDGTLTDPRLGITRCIRHALRASARPSPPDGELEKLIGPPLHQSFRELASDATEEEIAWMVDRYRDRFTETGMYENQVYDGITEALSALSSTTRLFVATSKPKRFADAILRHFGLMSFFVRVYGSQLDGSLSDKTELIAHILSAESIEPAASVMVGDRRHDMVGAKANGVSCLGVTWGYGTVEELHQAGAETIVDHPSDLIRLFAPLSPEAPI